MAYNPFYFFLNSKGQKGKPQRPYNNWGNRK